MKIYRAIIGFEFEIIPVFHDSFVYARTEHEAAFIYGYIFKMNGFQLTQSDESVVDCFDLITNTFTNQQN